MTYHAQAEEVAKMLLGVGVPAPRKRRSKRIAKQKLRKLAHWQLRLWRRWGNRRPVAFADHARSLRALLLAELGR